MRYSSIYKQCILLLFCALAFSCRWDNNLYKIEGERLEINDSLSGRADIEEFVAPFREHVNSNLDSVLSYAPETYTKNDGRLNTAIGNLMADLVFEQGNPIYESRTGSSIDMVILNHGGIRAIIPEGDITTRSAYEVMPFENAIVVAELRGEAMQELVEYLSLANRAHPISKMKMALDVNGEIDDVSINGEAIDSSRTYHVATSDYLFYGGDRMHFFKKNDTMVSLDYKIRNAMIDYFKKVDTIRPVIDDRFTTLKPEE